MTEHTNDGSTQLLQSSALDNAESVAVHAIP